MDLDSSSKLVQIIVTPIIAVIAGYIAWRQAETANNKLKLDLFDRRYALFLTVDRFLTAAFLSDNVSHDDMRAFIREVRICEFLFGSEIELFCEEVTMEIRRRNQVEAGDTDRYGGWIIDKMIEASDLFRPYLSFGRTHHSLVGRSAALISDFDRRKRAAQRIKASAKV